MKNSEECAIIGEGSRIMYPFMESLNPPKKSGESVTSPKPKHSDVEQIADSFKNIQDTLKQIQSLTKLIH